jgi:hypothetical protein
MVEVETQIHKVLDSAAVPLPGADASRRGITSGRVGTSGPVSAALTSLSLQCARDIVQGLEDSHEDTQGTDISADAPGRATSRASNGATRSHEERKRNRRAAGRAVRKQWMGTLTKSASSSEGETDQGETWPPSPPPRASSSQSWGVGSRQARPLVGERR